MLSPTWAHTALRLSARSSRSIPQNVRTQFPARDQAISTCLACRIRGGRPRYYSTTNQSQDTRSDKSPSATQAPFNNPSNNPNTTTTRLSEFPNHPRKDDALTSAELPSAADRRRSPMAARFSAFMDTLQGRAVTASQTLNDLTGYSAIEAIKRANASLETELAAAQSRLRGAREAYKTLNSSRASTQREVTTLLARKDTWSPGDLERFTTLYRADHEQEAKIAGATTELSEAEAEEDRLSAALNSGILKRYHEEQIWSDRIRRQSTWGTWGLMGVNILLFLVFQFVAEPWKRDRLMKGIAAEEKSALEEVRRELEEVKTVLSTRTEPAQNASVLSSGLPEQAADPEHAAGSGLWIKELVIEPKSWPAAFSDLVSERRIDLRMREAALLVVEGAVTGAAAAAIALILLRKAS